VVTKSTYYLAGFVEGKAGRVRYCPHDPTTHKWDEWSEGYANGTKNSTRGPKTNYNKRPQSDTTKTIRPCITCGDDFPSTGIGNRMCRRCLSMAAHKRGSLDDVDHDPMLHTLN